VDVKPYVSLRPCACTWSLTTATTPSNRLGEAIETLLRRQDAERFIADVRRDDPEFASHLRIAERELEAGGRN